MRTTNFTMLLVALALYLPACSTTKEPPLIPEGAVLNLQSIRLQALPGANRGRSVDVDLVYVYNEEQLRRLQGFNANGWFTSKKTGLLEWQQQLDIQEVQIAPGETREITSFPKSDQKAVALAVFADYDTPGLHRFFVVGGEQVNIRLEGQTYLVTA